MRVFRSGVLPDYSSSAFSCFLIAAGATIALTTEGQASGFFVREQSTTGMASAFAGASAGTGDASGMFYNPATIIDLDRNQTNIDLRLFMPDVEIEAHAATSLLGANAIGFGDSGAMADTAVAPAAFATTRISPDTVLGLGFSAPFAVVIETQPQWAGQYQLVKTEMLSWSVTPVIAHRLHETLTVSAGLNYQHFEVDLRKKEILPIAPPFVFAESLGFLRGEDEALGFVAGVLWEPHEETRIGLGYRSEVKHELSGLAGVELAAFPHDGAHFTVRTPQMVTLGLQQKLTDDLTFLGEVQWTEWSVFTGFDISFDSGRANELRPQVWQDTWFFSGGLRYQILEHTSVSAGFAVEEAISTGAGNSLSPDGDRRQLTFGISQDLSDDLTVNASYSHTWFDDAQINVTNTSGTLAGTFHSDLDIFGFSLTHRW